MIDFNFHNKSVVLLIKSAVLGGAERQALGLANYLINQFNCKVYLVCTHTDNVSKEFESFATLSGINKIHFFGTPFLSIKKGYAFSNIKKTIRTLKYLFKIRKNISTFKPDIIIPFLNSPSKIASLIYKGTGAKITFWHQLGLDSYTYDYAESKAVKKAPFIIANAENGLEVFKSHYKLDDKKLFVLPHYVSIKKVDLNRKKLREFYLINENAIVIGMISHYREEKYQELLLNAFSEIKTDKNIHLVLLGNKDNDKNTLQKFNNLNKIAKNKNVENKVSVLSGNSVEEVLNLLDIAVLVSKIEGTPTVVMEYMLYGLPVISSNHIGCINLLKESNFLIPNKKSVLIEKMKSLIEDPILRSKVGNENKKIIEKFSIENYVKSLTKIINKFL
jgi:glycosyltransferase involved in cell wall biosynthesis